MLVAPGEIPVKGSQFEADGRLSAYSRFKTVALSATPEIPGANTISTGGITLSIAGALVTAAQVLLTVTVYAPMFCDWSPDNFKEVPVPRKTLLLKYHW